MEFHSNKKQCTVHALQEEPLARNLAVARHWTDDRPPRHISHRATTDLVPIALPEGFLIQKILLLALAVVKQKKPPR